MNKPNKTRGLKVWHLDCKTNGMDSKKNIKQIKKAAMTPALFLKLQTIFNPLKSR